MNLEFLPEARTEFLEVVDYYEAKQSAWASDSEPRLRRSVRQFWSILCCGENGQEVSGE
jgi:hypothetical protein